MFINKIYEERDKNIDNEKKKKGMTVIQGVVLNWYI